MKPNNKREVYENKIFNYRLSRARRTVENAFGILASRFRIFRKAIDLSVEKVELITLTACALHNFIKYEDEVWEEFNYEVMDANLFQGTFVDMTVNVEDDSLAHEISAAAEIRKVFTNYFNNEGAVPWQHTSVAQFNF